MFPYGLKKKGPKALSFQASFVTVRETKDEPRDDPGRADRQDATDAIASAAFSLRAFQISVNALPLRSVIAIETVNVG